MARKDTLINQIKEKIGSIDVDKDSYREMFITFKDTFNTFSDSVTSRYQPNCKHIFSEVILIGFFGILSANNTWLEIYENALDSKDFLAEYLTLPAGIPSHDTIQRCFAILKTEELNHIMCSLVIELVNRFKQKLGIEPFINDEMLITDIIAVDGKAMLGSAKESSKNGVVKKLQMLNVYSTEYGLCLSSTPIDDKTNEIPVSQEVLSKMDLAGKVVTCDALNTQKNFSKIIKDQKGEYCLALKGNHGEFNNDLELYFSDQDVIKKLKKSDKCYYEITEKSHSQIEKRQYFHTNEVNWFIDLNQWHDIRGFGCVIKSVKSLKTNKISVEKRYYITSFTENVSLLAKSIRNHWHVESFHWLLDTTFKDDNNRTSEKTSAINLTTMKRFILSLIKIVKGLYNNRSMESIRRRIMRRDHEGIKEFFAFLASAGAFKTN